MVATRPRVQMSLQARFHASLSLARLNVTQWARQHGYSAGHVYGVLKGERVSPPCVELMERFIARYLGAERVA